MTEKQEHDLMVQIASIYQEWKVNGLNNNNERASALTNHLFDLAKEIDPKRMSAAFMMQAYDY
jgi:hypothetical protein